MMNSTPDLPTVAPPSLQRLARTTGVALVVAIAILVAFVLPAEYAIDPLGTGRWLGLTDIASPPGESCRGDEASWCGTEADRQGPNR